MAQHDRPSIGPSDDDRHIGYDAQVSMYTEVWTIQKFSEERDQPYYAVIFTAKRNGDDSEHNLMAAHLTSAAKKIPGFLGVDYVEDELCMMVSYWQSKESICSWMSHPEHEIVKGLGREKWYEDYSVRICLVEREYGAESRWH